MLDSPPQSLGSKFAYYARIYLTLWRNSVVREMQFKTNFILWIFVEILWFILQIGFLNVIYGHTEQIGTWTKYEAIFLMGTSQLIQQLFSAFFLNSCVQLPELIRTGKFDFMLLMPVNTRFLISSRQVDLGAFFNAGAAVAVMLYAGKQLHLSVSFTQAIGFCALLLVGVAIHYSLMILLASISFYTVRAQGIMWGYYNLLNIARSPDVIFKGAYRIIFTYGLPMILVANVPAKLIVKPLDDPWKVLLLLFMAVLCFAASEWVWRTSLRRYTSASS